MSIKKGIIISHKKASQILEKFKMKHCKPIKTPVEAGMKLRRNLQSKSVTALRIYTDGAEQSAPTLNQMTSFWMDSNFK